MVGGVLRVYGLGFRTYGVQLESSEVLLANSGDKSAGRV